MKRARLLLTALGFVFGTMQVYGMPVPLIANLWERPAASNRLVHVRRLAFTSNGNSLIQYEHATQQITLLDSNTGVQLTNISVPVEDPKFQIHSAPDPLLGAAQGPKSVLVGSRIAVPPGDDVTIVSEWNTETGWTRLARISDLRAHHFDSSPDGKWLLVGGVPEETLHRPDVGRLYLFALTNRALVTTTVLNEYPVQIAFSPDSTRVAVGNYCYSGNRPNRLRIYSVPGMQEVAVGEGFPPFGIFQFGPDPEEYLYTANVCTAMAVSSRGQIVSAESQIVEIFWRSDLVTNHVYIHDIVDGRLLRKIPAETNVIRCLSVSSDGRIVATGTGPGSAADLFETGAHCNTTQNFGPPSVNPSVRLFRIDDGKLLWEARLTETDRIGGYLVGPREIVLSPDMRHLAYSLDGGFVGYAQLPLLVTGFEAANGSVELSWMGGSGRYRIETTASLGQAWTGSGVMTNLSFSTPISETAAYFRVVDALE